MPLPLHWMCLPSSRVPLPLNRMYMYLFSNRVSSQVNQTYMYVYKYPLTMEKEAYLR